MIRVLPLIYLIAAAPALAVESWVPAGDGAYDDTANWSNNAVPVGGSSVLFDHDLSYMVTTDGVANKFVNDIDVPQGTLTLDMGNKSFIVRGKIGLFGVRIGTTPNKTATLNLTNGGMVMSDYYYPALSIGVGADTKGVLNISGSNTRFFGAGYGQLGVDGGEGFVNVTNGGTSSMGNWLLGYSGHGEMLIDGAGSSLSASQVWVGYQYQNGGTGYLQVLNGATLTSPYLRIYDGTMDVSGAGTFVDTEDAYFGLQVFDGSSLNISDNAKVYAKPGEIYGTLDMQTGAVFQSPEMTSVGTVNIPVNTLLKAWDTDYDPYTGNPIRGGQLDITRGDLNLDGGRLEADTINCSVDCDNFGNQSGTGALNLRSGQLNANEYIGELLNYGATIESGEQSPGRMKMTLWGDYIQERAAALSITIDGPLPAISHDVLEIRDDHQVMPGGNAYLDGLLVVEIGPNAAISAGNSFEFLTAKTISGQFTSIGNRCISPSLRWDLVYNLNPTATDTLSLQATQMPAGETCSGDPLIVQADIDPWNATDTVKPDSTNPISVALLGASKAAGDPIDFDVTQIDASSLKLGTNEALNYAGSALPDDYDNDGITDAAFLFRTEETGILCTDHEVMLTGSTTGGAPFEALASITTADCSPQHIPMAGVITVAGDLDTIYGSLPEVPRGLNIYRATLPGNERLLLNLLGNGSTVYFDYQGTSNSKVSDLYRTLGGATVADISAQEITNTLLADVDLLVLTSGPSPSTYTNAEEIVIRDFVANGGNVLLIAEMYYNESLNVSWNNFLNAIGTSIQFAPTNRCCDYSHFADTVLETPVSAGVDRFRIHEINDLTGGTPVIQDQSYTAVAYEQVMPVSVAIDVDPWNATNTIRPDSNNPITVAVMGSGDIGSIDVTDIDPDSLKLGAGEAPNTALAPLTGDYDSNGHTDAAFSFNTQDTGIFCDDTSVTLTGATYSGLSFEGTDTITTTDCDSGCHP